MANDEMLMKDKTDAEKYGSRIQELLIKLAEINTDSYFVDLVPETQNRDIVEGCFAGTVSVVESLYGINSSQMKSLFDTKKACTKSKHGSAYEIATLTQSLRGVLINAEEELERDLIRNIRTEATGEVIGDLLQLAKTELNASFVNVAAVLACAALEDALKRKANDLGLNTTGKTLDAIINALKAKSFFKGAQGPIVASFVKLRNAAMHADWDKISEADVKSLIGFMEPFLTEHFS